MAGEIYHSWNGTVLTITSDAGTSSMDLQGSKGDTGPRGPQGKCGVILDEFGNVIYNVATEEYVLEQIVNVQTGGTVDLKNYATVKYVDDLMKGVVFPNIDLTNYYTKAEIDIAIQTAIENVDVSDKGYQTEEQVLALIKANMPASGDEVNY